jgi:uncharacterized membrane protein YdjX (TVP38/TMEM64 family)
MSTKRSRWAGWALLACLVLGLILVPFLLGEQAVLAWTEAWFAQPGSQALVFGVVTLLLAADLLLPIPSSLVSAGAVAALGPVLGGAAVWLGMTVGAALGHAVGQSGGQAVALRFVGAAELERAARLHERFGTAMLVLCRGVPVLAEASTMLAGALHMRFGSFLFVTSAANLGLSLAYALSSRLGSGGFAMLAPFALGILVPALALGIVRLSLGRRE